MIPTRPSNPQHKIHHHSRQQRNSQHRRSEPIIKASLPSHPYALRSPVKRYQCVEHRRKRDESEEAGGDLAYAVAEVEQADGEAAEHDGEVEPGEEGALVGEEDFGFDADGEGDALAWAIGLALGGRVVGKIGRTRRSLEERLARHLGLLCSDVTDPDPLNGFLSFRRRSMLLQRSVVNRYQDTRLSFVNA